MTTSEPLADLMWNEKIQTQKSITLYDSIYKNFQKIQNKYMEIKVRILVDSVVGRIDQRGA